ncbi:MAG TPA: tellurite resistance TerB family protein [Sandaracinaceae bacterium LLY-WYZ-13_1]|nr:tellurite resistance TerB family protein [Sandaracinaceae bacterium LLY-WYZ-13_1]
MELDDRLKKIATGLSVSDAIDAYMQRLAEEGEVPDPEAAHREEMLAILEVMYLMAAVDGEISDEEVDELRASVAAIKDMEVVRDIRLDETMRTLGEKLAADGWKGRLEEAASRIRAPDAKTFAFQLAAGVAFVDDFVAHAEAAAIDSLAQALGLEKEESQALLREVHATLFEG